MTTIKLTSSCPTWNWMRQAPRGNGVWGNYTFACSTTSCDTPVCDTPVCGHWVVYENLPAPQTTTCPPQNTILITGEPPTVKTYHPKFLAQFGTIITTHTSVSHPRVSHANISHPNVITSHLSLPWMIGYNSSDQTFTKSYDELHAINTMPKPKLVSLICSNKTDTKGHRQRLSFVQKLREYFGNKIDMFGGSFAPLGNKWDAIAPYKYHIALENSAVPHYWTEKLSDTYLGLSHPIYFGCPNITDYFPKDSLTQIDIAKPEQAIKLIEQTINSNRYEESLEALRESKNLILNRYQLFPRITEFVKDMAPRVPQQQEKLTLYPEEHFYKNDPIVTKIIKRTKYFFMRRMPFTANGK